MSHFSVLVIGDGHEKQLAPFHEFECTGLNDEYVQNVDITTEVQADIDGGESLNDALSYYGLEEKVVNDETCADTDGDHTYGYAVVRDGKLIKAVNRTNPNKQWDWWVVGGRWSHMLKLKAGGSVNQAKKGDIDFDGMRDADGNAAAELWDKVATATNGVTWQSWEVMRAKHAGNIDAARDEYHAQPGVIAAQTAVDNRFCDPDQFLTPRAQYIQRARNSATATYAIVKNSKWFQRGEMGWWGVSINEIDSDIWHAKVVELLAELPDDTLLTVVDCHI